MEFYEFFELICSCIPDDFPGVKSVCELLTPILFALLTSATCFVGHFMHRIWNKFFFFNIGFWIPLLILFAIFRPSGILFWILTVCCVGFGIFCAVKADYLHKSRLFVTTFLMVYITVSGDIFSVGAGVAVLLGLFLGIVAAVLSIKYKYITVIVTTAFSGSFMFWEMMEDKLALNHILVMVVAVLMGIIGLLVQCHVERKELKESFEHIKRKTGKIKDRAK